MKLKIKYKLFDPICDLKIFDKGDWIDLTTRTHVELKAPHANTLKYKRKEDDVVRSREVVYDTAMLHLGIAMELPKGYEALLLPRSSTFKNFGIMLLHSMGVIDNSYNGDEDEWKFNALALKDTSIPRGSRVCQFRIQLSQKATIWQKIKWMFVSKIEFVKVETLNNENRGGFGTSGK